MDLKELEKFLKICRKQGVTEISHEGTSLKFGDMPVRARNDQVDTEDSDEIVNEGSISDEELAFYHLKA